MINHLNSILCQNVLDGLLLIPDNCVHLIVTSPPFNVGIQYSNYADCMPHVEYLAWMKRVWAECYRVLVSGGRICINIDATMNMEGEPAERTERVHPLHVDFTNQLRELGYIYRGEIVWGKQNASGKDTCWGSFCSCSNPHIRRNHEYIILVSKESLRLDGDANMCDLTKDEFCAWTLSDWRITPETRKNYHPAPFPRELVKRCVKLFSYVGNVVLDCFNGSGTTTTTAYELGRQFIGIDNSEQYCSIARAEIDRVRKEFEISGPYSFIPSTGIKRPKSIEIEPYAV